jgi:hypothetical protein
MGMRASVDVRSRVEWNGSEVGDERRREGVSEGVSE